MDAPSRRTPTHWTLPRLMGTRWSRTLFLSILVGLLSGLAARALESLVDLGFPRLIGRIANTTAGRLFESRWGVLLLP